MPKKRAHIVYSGNVHGVGFRWTAERAAFSLHLTGWVMNCPNGTVEVTCEGREGDINAFIDRVKEEMSGYIGSARVSRQEATGEFNSFNIRFH